MITYRGQQVSVPKAFWSGIGSGNRRGKNRRKGIAYDDLPLFLNAKTVAKVLGVSPSSGYELLHDPGFPVMRVGNRMVVPKEQFIQWVSDHTGGGT